jgi:signal transduction histidine kinase
MFDKLVYIQYCFDTFTQIPVSLLLYSHIPTSLFALLFSIFILRRKKTVASQSLFLVCLLFFVWCFLNLNAWFSFMGAGNTMFTWSIEYDIAILMFFFSFRFFYSYVWESEITPTLAIYSFILLSPTLLATGLNINLTGFDSVNCEAIEENFMTMLFFATEALFIVTVIAYAIRAHIVFKDSAKRRQSFFAATGIVLFLSFFFSSSFITSLLLDYTTIQNPYNYEIYGLFGMPILLAFLGYLIVKFKAFDIKLAGAQALVFALITLIASQFSFVESRTNTILVSVTLFFSVFGGFFLVKSVKKEIKQREELELLTQALEKANVRLRELDKQKSEFVSIASHQLRSPLTAMRGYASMLVEGSFGKIPEKALEAARRIEESSKLMAISVEDYLNVSRIESGNMKYNLSDFNVKEMTESICDDLRSEALKQNLILLFRSDVKSRGVVNADVGKTNQIIHNLINNSIKYTPKGTINVFVRDDIKHKRIYIDITDTGIGMSQETIHTLFQKFNRAENANTVNVSGTGLGLYVALKMAEAMGGTISCKSEGDGKGSTFTFELPLAM